MTIVAYSDVHRYSLRLTRTMEDQRSLAHLTLQIIDFLALVIQDPDDVLLHIYDRLQVSLGEDSAKENGKIKK